MSASPCSVTWTPRTAWSVLRRTRRCASRSSSASSVPRRFTSGRTSGRPSRMRLTAARANSGAVFASAVALSSACAASSASHSGFAGEPAKPRTRASSAISGLSPYRPGSYHLEPVPDQQQRGALEHGAGPDDAAPPGRAETLVQAAVQGGGQHEVGHRADDRVGPGQRRLAARHRQVCAERDAGTLPGQRGDPVAQAAGQAGSRHGEAVVRRARQVGVQRTQRTSG